MKGVSYILIFRALIMNNILGIKALALSVNLVANGTAPRVKQTAVGATYDAALFKPETHQVST